MGKLNWTHFAAALACNIVYNLNTITSLKPSAFNQLLHVRLGSNIVGSTFVDLITICVGIIGLIALGWILKTAWNKIGKNFVQNEYELSLSEGAFLAVLLNTLF